MYLESWNAIPFRTETIENAKLQISQSVYVTCFNLFVNDMSEPYISPIKKVLMLFDGV